MRGRRRRSDMAAPARAQHPEIPVAGLDILTRDQR